MSLRRILLTAALGVAVGAGPVLVGPAQADHYRNLGALLTGRQEVPGPGDPTAWGAANVRVWPGTGRLCYTLFIRGVDGTVDGAHLHLGRRGETGPMIVALEPPTAGWSRGCRTVDRDDAEAIADTPRAYYVNIHSTAFVAGAVRGQLTGHDNR